MPKPTNPIRDPRAPHLRERSSKPEVKTPDNPQQVMKITREATYLTYTVNVIMTVGDELVTPVFAFEMGRWSRQIQRAAKTLT